MKNLTIENILFLDEKKTRCLNETAWELATGLKTVTNGKITGIGKLTFRNSYRELFQTPDADRPNDIFVIRLDCSEADFLGLVVSNEPLDGELVAGRLYDYDTKKYKGSSIEVFEFDGNINLPAPTDRVAWYSLFDACYKEIKLVEWFENV